MPDEETHSMLAVVTTGIGDYDKLVINEVPIPILAQGEVLLKVLAAGVNNTDINTRLGWYSSSVSTGTKEAAFPSPESKKDGGWNGATPFPIIQGTDCCGRVVAVADSADATMIGARVLVRACMRPKGYYSREMRWMGSDFDGAFAQFVKVPATEVFAVACAWTDAELATIPCSYATAENMLHRASVTKGARVLITGASGGVGSAAVQLAKRRGALVTGIAANSKLAAIRSIGADHAIARGSDLVAALDKDSIDVVVDNVGGPDFRVLLEALKRGGTYVSSGAIASPLVGLDLRTLYLKDLSLLGCTAWDEATFRNLVSYIERGELRPLLQRTYPLDQIVAAQRDFLEKRHVGKLVLIPPS